MTQTPGERSPALYEFAEWVLADEQRRGVYDDAKMHWMGDPDPGAREHGRHPWVKRIRSEDGPEYVYSQPVLAAFCIAKRSLMSIRKDPWHLDSNPEAWFIGIHSLETGEISEPLVTEATVSKYGQAWLRLDERGPRMRRDQKRVELRLRPGHHSSEARYVNGLREWPEVYEDIVALEAMMRAINQTHGILLPNRLAPVGADRDSYYGRAA